VADESDEGATEREVLTNLPRTRPARRSARRAPAAGEASDVPEAPARASAKRASKAAPKPKAQPKPARKAAARRAPSPSAPPAPRAPVPPQAAQERSHVSALADLTVAGIEFTGAMLAIGMDVTRAILRATVGRLPRP